MAVMAANEPMINGLARRVYETILRTANRFLTQSRKYKVQFLATENPSYQDVANLIEGARALVHEAIDATDPMQAQQATEYCQLMTQMAAAIIEQDQAKLDRLCDELERKPFVMPQ